MATSSTGSPRFFDSVRGLLNTGVGLLQTRLELASIELQEEKQRLLHLTIIASATVVFGGLFLIMLTFAVIVTTWDTPGLRLPVVWGFCGFYGLGALALFFSFANVIKHAPRLFDATLGELRKDKAWLSAE